MRQASKRPPRGRHGVMSCLLAVAGIIALTPASHAQAQLPPGAQPGSVQPPRPDPLRPRVDQPVFEIPPVFERPLGVEEGERVFVRGFRVVGIVDDPEAGISEREAEARARQRLEDIRALLEELRVERQNQENVDQFGFTPEQRQRILDFMEDVVADLSPDRRTEAYQRFIDQLRLENLTRDRGLTIGQLQLVANEITQYYRERGFFLARAVIPAQEVIDGIVTIRVLEGRLGEVAIEGNRRYAAETLRAPFNDLAGELIRVEDVEAALLTLKSYPGVNAFGVFRPGTEVGKADILVNVQQEHLFDASVRADNHGTRFTGEARLLGEFDWHNPFGGADQLGATLLQTFTPENALYGELRYNRALPDPSYRAGIQLSRNTFDVADDTGQNLGVEVGGVATVGRLYLEKHFQRTRETKIWGLVDLNRKQADTEFGSLLANRDELASLGVQLNFELLDSAGANIHAGFVRIDQGLDGIMGVPDAELAGQQEPLPSRSGPDPDGQGIDFAGSDFAKLTLGYSRLKSLGADHSLLFRFNGQYSKDILTSLEQFVIGGPTSVRALPTSQYLADSGYFASLEYNVRAPFFADQPAFAGHNWGQVLGVTLFVDYAVGLINQPFSNQPRRLTAGGRGVGIQFGLPGRFSANLQVARLNGGERPAIGVNTTPVEDDMQYWLDFTWFF